MSRQASLGRVGRVDVDKNESGGAKMLDRVHIVEENSANRTELERQLTREGLRVSTFATVDEFVSSQTPIPSGCVIADWGPSESSATELLRRLKTLEGLPLPVIFLCECPELRAVIATMREGAYSILGKPVSYPELASEARSALEVEQERYPKRLEASIARLRLATLTPDEATVLRHVLAGYANKQTASFTGMALRTVEKRRHAITEKLGASSVPELVRIAIASGDLSLGFLDGQTTAMPRRAEAATRSLNDSRQLQNAAQAGD